MSHPIGYLMIFHIILKQSRDMPGKMDSVSNNGYWYHSTSRDNHSHGHVSSLLCSYIFILCFSTQSSQSTLMPIFHAIFHTIRHVYHLWSIHHVNHFFQYRLYNYVLLDLRFETTCISPRKKADDQTWSSQTYPSSQTYFPDPVTFRTWHCSDSLFFSARHYICVPYRYQYYLGKL